MLSPTALISDLNPVQWRRLTELAYGRPNRRLFLIHEGGRPVKLYDSEGGALPTPTEPVGDPQAAADRLLASHPGVSSAWVVDPEPFRKALAEVQAATSLDQNLDDYVLMEWERRREIQGFAMAPQGELLWHSLPLKRLKSFVEKMLPSTCSFVLAVFDGEALWASAIVQFQDKKIVAIQTTDALDQADLKDVVGRDQHPFLLSMVANTFRRPAFGWFVERPVFEAWMKAPDMEGKDEVFQRAIMENKATFDFNVLVDRHLTAFSPINPGEAAVQGQDRESNPRTRTPDPDEPGPSAV